LSIFSFVRSGIVTGAGLGTSFCACTALQLIRTTKSTAKAIPVFFMVAILLEARIRAFTYPDTAAASPVRIEPGS
jgi:hypothetical protein